jgi:hypothetical protein
VTPGLALFGEVTDPQVQRAIERGVALLKSTQDDRGGWDEYLVSHGGVTPLCTLALLSAGVPIDDPAMQRALENVRKFSPNKTYAVSLQTMVLAAATPSQDRLRIRKNVMWLQRNQVKSGNAKGGWYYGENSSSADNSNSQFALPALHEAERIGVEVDEQVSTWTWNSLVPRNGVRSERYGAN